MEIKKRLLGYLFAFTLPLIFVETANAQLDQAHYLNEARQNDSWYKKSVANAGDVSILKAIMAKAKSGQPVTIGVIGGSITEGSGASDAKNTSYGPLITKWWQEKFPQTTFTFINAGIGATGSMYGVHRVDKDLLSFNPDFVIIEFSVNDINEKDATESYEGLVRKILKHNPATAILAIATTWNNGQNWQEKHLEVCKHYNIPMISYRDAIWPEVAAKNIEWKDISPDVVHPNDRGHAYIAGLTIRFLENVYNQPVIAHHSINFPKPLTKNRFEKSTIADILNLGIIQTGNWRKKQEGWLATSNGAPLIFKVKGRFLQIMYKRTNNSTGAKAYVLIDGKSRTNLDADFAGGWGQYPAITPILIDGKRKRHKVSVYFDDTREKHNFLIYRILEANY